MIDKTKAVFKAADVSEILGIPYRKLYSWAVKGYVPMTGKVTRKVYSTYRFNAADIARIQVLKLCSEAKIHMSTASKVCKSEYYSDTLIITPDWDKVIEDVQKLLLEWVNEMTGKKLAHYLLENYPDEQIAYDLWVVGDIMDQASARGIVLNKEQASEILAIVNRNKNAGTGINLSLVDTYTDMLLGGPK